MLHVLTTAVFTRGKDWYDMDLARKEQLMSLVDKLGILGFDCLRGWCSLVLTFSMLSTCASSYRAIDLPICSIRIYTCNAGCCF
eukprot:scaffold648363_cov45-Prasinocladus_malaysianus.AAC.1